MAHNFALLGATDAQMASFFRTTLFTLNNWKRQFPAFSNALKDGKLAADALVSKSLFHSARGYSHQAVKIFLSEATGGVPVTVPYVEHHPPNATSCIFWLKNRRPDLWRDQKNVELTGSPEKLTDGQLAAELARRGVVIDGDFEVVEGGAGANAGAGGGVPPTPVGKGRLLGALRSDLLRPRRAQSDR